MYMYMYYRNNLQYQITVLNTLLVEILNTEH